MSLEVYVYVIVALYAIPLIPLLVLGLLALRGVKDLGDPVRHGLIWFHCAVWFYFISLLMKMIVMSIAVSSAVSNARTGFVTAMTHVELTAVLLEMFGFFTLIMSITYLAVGAHQADSQKQSRQFLNFMRILVGLTTILYSIYFVYQQWRFARGSAWFGFAIVQLIIMIFVVVATLANVIFASVKYRKNRRHAREAGTHHSTKQLWALIIAMSSVGLVIALWKLLAFVLVGVSWEIYHHGFWVMTVGLWVITVVNLLVEYWFAIAVLVLIYVLGKKTIGGLYSGEVPVFKDSSVEGGVGVVV